MKCYHTIVSHFLIKYRVGRLSFTYFERRTMKTNVFNSYIKIKCLLLL